jgi:hypothetical protein
MRLSLVTLALLLAAMPATAADVLKVEITPFVSYRFGGTFDVEGSTASYEIEDSAAVGLLLNLRQTGNTQWEILYSLQQSEAQLRGVTVPAVSVDTDIHVLQLGGTYQGDGEKVRPYVAVTLGGTHIKTAANRSQSDSFFSGSIGVGLNLNPNKRLGLRFEARAYGTLMDSNTDLFCQTGPDANICAIRIDGNLLSQFEISAGVIFRF